MAAMFRELAFVFLQYHASTANLFFEAMISTQVTQHSNLLEHGA